MIHCDSRLEAKRRRDTMLSQDIHHLLNQLGCLGKICLLQWIPAHVVIEYNEEADKLAGEARKLDQETNGITLADANALARSRLIPQQSGIRYQITDINEGRKISTIIARLYTGYFRRIWINPDDSRTYETEETARIRS